MDKYFVLDYKNGDQYGGDKPIDTLEKAISEMESQLAHLTMKERKSRDIMVVIGECEDDCLIGDYNVVYREV